MSLVQGLSLGLVYIITIVSEGLGATWIGRERTYWPVLRLQKATLAAALTWYVSVAVLSALEPGILGTFIANAGGVVMVMLESVWSLWLIWRRNHTPAFLLIDLSGVPHAKRPDFERILLDGASAARHGFINEELAEIMARSLERWRAMTPEERALERARAAAAMRRTGRRRRPWRGGGEPDPSGSDI